ncbi:hypothetical protein B0H16DRAFT_1739621 [Mycena metata]|uniref:Uncharacterized protein n=1 Tax=Mycena metata TaxID=1033252 RepID=A0AAD7HGC0_9AGAR|nr:hypothetical protein B0H16DRAFT_1739621 [Mycena metata]
MLEFVMRPDTRTHDLHSWLRIYSRIHRSSGSRMRMPTTTFPVSSSLACSAEYESVQRGRSEIVDTCAARIPIHGGLRITALPYRLIATSAPLARIFGFKACRPQPQKGGGYCIDPDRHEWINAVPRALHVSVLPATLTYLRIRLPPCTPWRETPDFAPPLGLAYHDRNSPSDAVPLQRVQLLLLLRLFLRLPLLLLARRPLPVPMRVLMRAFPSPFERKNTPSTHGGDPHRAGIASGILPSCCPRPRRH